MPPAYRAQGFPPNILMSKVHVWAGKWAPSRWHTQRVNCRLSCSAAWRSLAHRGPSRKALMQTLRVLADLSVECCEVLSSGKVLQFSQRQPAPEATQAKRRSEDPLLMLELRDCTFLPILDWQSSWQPCGDVCAALVRPISFGELAEPASST